MTAKSYHLRKGVGIHKCMEHIPEPLPQANGFLTDPLIWGLGHISSNSSGPGASNQTHAGNTHTHPADPGPDNVCSDRRQQDGQFTLTMWPSLLCALLLTIRFLPLCPRTAPRSCLRSSGSQCGNTVGQLRSGLS